ncbi:MAG: hypothetical protein WBF81_02835, partial [Thermoplasmata archaeon]
MNFSDNGSPLPTTPTDPRWLAFVVAMFVAGIVFGALLFTGNFPGLPGHITSDVSLDGHEYYSDWYPAPFPSFGQNTTAPSEVTFHNVTFRLWISGWGSPYGSYLHGNGTELNGTPDAFVLGGPVSNASRATLYLSADAKFAVGW